VEISDVLDNDIRNSGETGTVFLSLWREPFPPVVHRRGHTRRRPNAVQEITI
jgi:hypothetical protein